MYIETYGLRLHDVLDGHRYGYIVGCAVKYNHLETCQLEGRIYRKWLEEQIRYEEGE